MRALVEITQADEQEFIKKNIRISDKYKVENHIGVEKFLNLQLKLKGKSFLFNKKFANIKLKLNVIKKIKQLTDGRISIIRSIMLDRSVELFDISLDFKMLVINLSKKDLISSSCVLSKNKK